MKISFKNMTFGLNIILMLFISLGLFTSCDKEVSRSPVEPEPLRGKIVISSEPEQSLIFLNGRNTGRFTPDSLTFLDDGEYTVTLKRKYFKDTTLAVTILRESREELYVDYKSNPSMYGRLALFSNPSGGGIILNDSTLNLITPDTISGLLPGEYNVRIKLPNHREAIINTIVQSSKLNNYSVVLRDTSEWIDYQVINSEIQSNLLTCITIDSYGFKWIGTSDKGLIRFDGENFTNYTKTNSNLPSNIINCVTATNDNKIWIGTNEGLTVFDGSSWITYNMNNSGLTANTINSIEFDENGKAWIGASSGLFRFDGLNWTRYNDSELRLWVLSTKIDGDKIWIGTNTSGIMSLKDEVITYYPDTTFLYLSNKITAIDLDNSGNIWFSHSPDSNQRSGVSYFNGSNFTSLLFSSTNIAVNNLFIDKQNNKWVSTFNGLLKYDSGNTSLMYSTLNSLISSNRCTDSVVDSDGSVWITTSGGGLNKLKVY